MAPIEGTDIAEITPVNGIFHVAGIIRKPNDIIRISWEVDGSSGVTECQAWGGQYEIDCLAKAGYLIKSVGLA